MITASVRKADFDEINIHNVTKIPIIDAIKVFWQKDDIDFNRFLKSNEIDYTKQFNSLNEMMDITNNYVAILNKLANNDEYRRLSNFDYAAIKYFQSKSLKFITEFDFVKFTLDLKNIKNETIKQEIKKLALQTPNVALISFKEVSNDNFALIHSKKGAFYYCNEPFMSNIAIQTTLLENFQVPKNNNFIMARFLLKLAKTLKEHNIEESFCVNYSDGNQKIVTIDEIIECGEFNLEQKKAFMESLRNKNNIENLAKEQAQVELKNELNAIKRNSLTQKESKNMLNNAKGNIVIDNNIDEIEFDRLFSSTIDEQEKNINEIYKKHQTRNAKIIESAINLYIEKEKEKLNIRLEKAQKDSERAYSDLKKYLDNGASILEAIQNIKQKYSEDTVHLASLIFSQDILHVKNKDEIINQLYINITNLKSQCDDLNEKLNKKDETISSLKSTIQKKINEIQNLEYDLSEAFKQKTLKIKEDAENEKNDIITKYDNELAEIDRENEELNEINKELEKTNKYLLIKNEAIEKELQTLESIKVELYKDQIKIESFNEKENMYKQQIEKLEQQLNKSNDLLKSVISNIESSQDNDDK